ncbi:alpha/beta hydrolase [Legionella fairfieldensis]|uniref:alpha/beta hydrolase n=1 Tax=Legionella fairfieldensis TaxID=45064 RepID=UPI0004901F3A|nr:alpha/beta hydrolase [Legionella fairfieldensis]
MIKQLFIVSFLVLLVVSSLIFLLQRHLIYFPAKERPDQQTFHAEDMQQVTLHTPDGLSLNAWYKPAAPNQPTLLYLHGNAGHMGHRMTLIRQFLTVGFGVLIFDYRGYGGNKGSPSEQGLYTDGRTGLQFLYQQGVPAKKLVLYGESLGTGVATQLAIEAPACALILQSPYTSLAALARYHYPWLLIQPRDKFDSLNRMAAIKVPVLIVHGKQDKIVPFTQGLTLFNQANEPKKLLVMETKGHNNLWDNDFTDKINGFIRANCL